ncbi:related to RNAse III [Rhynchosporium secalis]|uniref:Related to RNAse III n=1 Tax=Rhynchosporium secalis TaxID=38038 RepID=A0A1E1MTI2_RHYSE|nr:related to RNAse III [Rhynchosporium secalis]
MSRQGSIPAVEGIIDYIFNDKELLWRALHAAGSREGGNDGNKTLAMLGDAVLKVVVLDDLIPTGASRGNQRTDNIVSNENLAGICTTTGLAQYINGNPSQWGEQQTKTKTATIEAIFGAVFLDSGKKIDCVRTAMAALGLGARVG